MSFARFLFPRLFVAREGTETRRPVSRGLFGSEWTPRSKAARLRFLISSDLELDAKNWGYVQLTTTISRVELDCTLNRGPYGIHRPIQRDRIHWWPQATSTEASPEVRQGDQRYTNPDK